ncbi:methyltransferase dimerization domain-containing protein [Halobaculum gomorrense]|uniref:Dimerisation domain-containing protein n=1 Tax=Halobaculum gomorrense TaxID=43928 RepID=A0A1M5LZG3_9EURY|nr:methyltransferase dimerization domain-containing protein [Halobaculum gomorrense]SHG70376.1 Dimerisation domain-containing protein [Halobaculum gomorrense]
MPVAPSLLERLAFRANLAPPAILDVHGAASLHALALADDLGVFGALDEPRPLAATADAFGCDAEGLRSLLDAPVAVGYLGRSGDEYWRTRTTDRWLTPDAVNRSLGDAGLATVETASFRRAPGVRLLLAERPYRAHARRP